MRTVYVRRGSETEDEHLRAGVKYCYCTAGLAEWSCDNRLVENGGICENRNTWW